MLVLLASACGGASVAAPSATCSPDLDVGTACSPAESAYVRSAFAGKEGPDDLADLYADGRFAGTLICAEDPEDSMLCAIGSSGSTIVVPVDMPDGRRVRFSGGDLPSAVEVDLGEGDPVGVRYSGPSIRIDIMEDDKELYGFNTIEIGVVDSAGAEESE